MTPETEPANPWGVSFAAQVTFRTLSRIFVDLSAESFCEFSFTNSLVTASKPSNCSNFKP